MTQFVKWRCAWRVGGEGLTPLNMGEDLAGQWRILEEVFPSGRDMAPGSEYVQSLYATPLNKDVEYTLIYSHHAASDLLLPKPNDDVVAVEGELFAAVVDDGGEVVGIDDTHTGVLSDPDVINLVSKILDRQSWLKRQFFETSGLTR